MAQENFTPLRGGEPRPSIETRWEELRANIRKTWPALSKEDLKSVDGDSRKLIALVHQKTGADISEIESMIDELAVSSEGLLSRVTRSAQHAFESASEHVTQPISHAYAATRDQISEAPGRSIGISFGLGLLIGICTASLIKDYQERSHQRAWYRF